jgi:transcriptional pleiotropic regulator of transition state genes
MRLDKGLSKNERGIEVKSTGIVRRVDELGRIVIPKEIREKYGIEEKDGMEIFVESDRIILRKYQPADTCIFCGSEDHLIHHKGKLICKDCLKSIKDGVG